MNLLYECKECKQTWTELKKECPDCGSEEYTVIQDDGDPASSFWKWAGIFAMSAVAVGALCFWYTTDEDTTNTGDWKFEITEKFDNHFIFESNYDSLVFKSLVNAQELTVDEYTVYPCTSGEFRVYNSRTSKSKIFDFDVVGKPHLDACNCDCSKLLSFSADIDCNYKAESAKSDCNTSLRISFDKINWSNEGELKFSKSIVGTNSKLYYKFSCMPVVNIKEFTVKTCSIPPPKPAPSVESLNEFLDEAYTNKTNRFKDVYIDFIYRPSGDNQTFHYKNSLGEKKHHFNDLFLFDLEDIRLTDPGFAIESVEYNTEKTRILKVIFNNLN